VNGTVRVALIFDDTLRPDTMGVYCRRALGELVRVRHFLPEHLEQIPASGFDLYVNVDDGLRYRLPPRLRPCAWWAIDTHLDFAWYRTKAVDFDFVFAAQRDGAERLSREVCPALWLPLACDPHVHRKHDVAKRFDVAFVGNPVGPERIELLGILQERFPQSFIGRCYGDAMAEVYSASRTVFNRSVGNDVNMRVFEALACGSLLVTNDLADNGQDELFCDGRHLALYRTADELPEKISWYLAHAGPRQRIEEAGRSEVLRRHTYRHRMETLLGEIKRRLRRGA
jgi:hypothetical protein